MTTGTSRPSPADLTIPANLRASSLAFAWRNRPVLRDVDLTLRPGSVTALRGANGAGKTTLLRLLASMLEPDAGSIMMGSLDSRLHRRAYVRRIGITTAADRGLYARLDVRANLQLAAALTLVARSRETALIDRSLDRFALSALSSRRTDRLSTGQRQRVRLAMAFLHEPDVVLLDEPTASLDSNATELLARALAELADRGASALWAVPDGSSPPLPADQICLLSDGQLETIA